MKRMNMVFTMTMMAALVLGLFAGQVLAQQPGGGGGGGGEEEEFDVKKALEEVARLLGESEKLLVESIAPRESATPEEAEEQARGAAEAIEKLLRQSEKSGAEAAEKMKEILEKAPQGGGGGSGEQEDPSQGEDEKRKQDERKVDERDPMNSGHENQPKDGEENKDDPSSATKKPESEKDDPSNPDPKEDWLSRLPEKIRLAYKNGEWERIPEKYRQLIEAYTKRMAEIESDR